MTIKARRKKLEEKEKKLKLQMKLLEAQFEFLYSTCEHPNKRTWTHTDYGGGSDLHEHCDDCGWHRTT